MNSSSPSSAIAAAAKCFRRRAGSVPCGVCARNCPTKAIELVRRPIQVITPVNSTHCFVLQAIEKGTLRNLIIDNQAFVNHRAMAAVFGTILKLPPLKQAMASKQFKSSKIANVKPAAESVCGGNGLKLNTNKRTQDLFYLYHI